MRLPIAISAILMASLSLNTPVMSQPTVRVAQSPAIASSNGKKVSFNRRLWYKQQIYNYRYTLTRSCFCQPKATEPVVIEVRNGVTTSITSAKTGQRVDPKLFQSHNTIPKLFNIIYNAIDRKAANLSVQYNPKLGYPTQINIDYNRQIADEELYLTIENLQKIY